MDDLGRILQTARRAKRLTQQDAGAELGVSHAAIQQWEAGKTKPTVANLSRAADLYGIDADAALQGRLVLRSEGGTVEVKLPKENAFETYSRAHAVPPIEEIRSGSRDVPVYGIAVGGTDGDFSLNGEVLEYRTRPPGLVGQPSIYAVYIHNDSMSPRFEDGEIVYVQSKRPPAIGDYVIIDLLPEQDGDPGRGFIKRLEARTPTKIVVSQFNPVLRIEFDRSSIRNMHRVIPWGEVIGV